MKHATMNFGTDKFGRSAAGLVYGGLHVRIDEQRFPHPGWTDFVVVVLAWWCRALTKVIEGQRHPVEARFMEGPYLAMVGPLNGDSLRLELVEAGMKRRVLYEADVLSEPLINSVIAAAEAAISECRNRDWWSKDTDELMDAVSALKRKGMRSVN